MLAQTHGQDVAAQLNSSSTPEVQGLYSISIFWNGHRSFASQNLYFLFIWPSLCAHLSRNIDWNSRNPFIIHLTFPHLIVAFALCWAMSENKLFYLTSCYDILFEKCSKKWEEIAKYKSETTTSTTLKIICSLAWILLFGDLVGWRMWPFARRFWCFAHTFLFYCIFIFRLLYAINFIH